MKRYLAVGLFAALSLAVSAAAQAEKPISLQDILQSSNTYYPRVEEAIAKQAETGGRVQSATGAFDARLDADVNQRISGFYSGDSLDAKVIKPLPFSGAQVYGGYRRSNGSFPVYEGGFETQDGGEANIGFIFSLLRNRAIDAPRAELQDAKLEERVRGLEIMLTRLNVQMKAAQAYAEWVAAGQIVGVYKQLLQLAEERQKNLEGRKEAGDVARIILVENNQNILKRRAALNDAEQSFIRKTNQLSLFLRDAEGNPVRPARTGLPKSMPVPQLPDRDQMDTTIENVVRSHPEIAAVELERERQQVQLQVGENALLPKLDLGVEVSKDMGQGPQTLEDTEGKAMLKVSIPLQTQFGEGKIAASKAGIKRLGEQARLLQDTLRAELQSLAAELYLNKSNLDISADEVKLARKMQDAEKVLLDNGNSNLFLLNTREERLAEAEVKNILARLYLAKSLAGYQAGTLDLAALGIVEAQGKN